MQAPMKEVEAPLDNPLCTDGFEFVEFTSDRPRELEEVFEQLGFVAVGRHRSKDVIHYRQGDVNLILNRERDSQAARFAAEHGSSANAMAFRVTNAAHAFRLALQRGAKPVRQPVGPMELNIPAIEGIGGLVIYLVDRYGAHSIYDVDFEPIEGHADPFGAGLTYIDHLTHNLYRGNMDQWAKFYEEIFNFREIRYFDIEGEATGL
ncbi:MAG: VOC family protein, partial [Gammaproteobacteria bacterium]